MISCADAVRQLWAYLEQELSATDRALVEAHLDVCRRCCGEVEFADELRRFLAQTPPELPADVRRRLEGFIGGLGRPR